MCLARRRRSASLGLAAPEPIRFCSATAVIYRASVFQTVGLFEETFDSYLEDVDFGLRCALPPESGWYFPTPSAGIVAARRLDAGIREWSG